MGPQRTHSLDLLRGGTGSRGNMRHRIASLVLSLVVGSQFLPAEAAAQQFFVLEPSSGSGFQLASAMSKLAPELEDVIRSRSTFRGLTPDGQTVIAYSPEISFTKMAEALSAIMPRATGPVEEVPFIEIDRLIVSVSGGAEAVNLDGLFGVKIAKIRPDRNVVIIESENGFSADQLSRIQSIPSVEYIEPDYPYFLADVDEPASADDTYFKRQWGLASIGVEAAWAEGVTSDVIVAVLDTGLDYNHPDLGAWKNGNEIANNGIDDDNNGCIDDIFGCDFFNSDGDPMDDVGHGTEVAGVIGAIGNNGRGVAGVVWGAQILPVKVFGKRPGRLDVTMAECSDLVDAIQYALNNNARIFNLSWGGPYRCLDLKRALDRATSQGALVVAAAGNDGTNNDNSPIYPASFSNKGIISAMAIGRDRSRWQGSNFGASSVDIAAPGQGIWTTSLTSRPTKYRIRKGTSFAAPFVVGAAALIWARPEFRNFDRDQIKSTVLAGAQRTPDLHGTSVSGGVLDLRFLATEELAADGASSLLGAEPAEDQTLTITGTLRFPHYQLGGETTGIVVETETRLYELEVQPDAGLERLLKHLDGETVTYSGRLKRVIGEETGERLILQPIQ